jgi:hypothetical protein
VSDKPIPVPSERYAADEPTDMPPPMAVHPKCEPEVES